MQIAAPVDTRPPTPLPATPTNTPVINYTATAQVQQETKRQAQGTADAAALPASLGVVQPKQLAAAPASVPVSFSRNSRLVLAHYFAWFDGDGWDDCNISAGDKPLHPYHSDDPATITRHIQMARDIGLNGFLLHWFAPEDRTNRNFGVLLNQSLGTDFASSVVFSRHIFHGSPAPSAKIIADALNYILGNLAGHPNFLRLNNKPVIFFTDVYRTPAGQSPQQFWAAIRNQVDPQRQTWWIAEGLDPTYLDVFDGLYVFKISHAAYPHDYVKSPRWGARVKGWENSTGAPKLWMATISPGWDDLRSGCKPDVRVDNTAHRLDRAGGAVFEATFDAAMQSEPDWLLVGSFNEWVEGTYIEPSAQYGDKYMQMTQNFVSRFKGQ